MAAELPRRVTPPVKPVDIHEVFAGRCGTCRVLVETTLLDTAKPKGGWGFAEQRTAECPVCGAAVLVGSTGRSAPPPEVYRTKALLHGEQRRPPSGVVEKMMDALVRGEDVELTAEEEAEAAELERRADEAEVKFLVGEN